MIFRSAHILEIRSEKCYRLINLISREEDTVPPLLSSAKTAHKTECKSDAGIIQLLLGVATASLIKHRSKTSGHRFKSSLFDSLIAVLNPRAAHALPPKRTEDSSVIAYRIHLFYPFSRLRCPLSLD